MATRMLESEEGEHTSDDDFSPGHLVIDMEDEEEGGMSLLSEISNNDSIPPIGQDLQQQQHAMPQSTPESVLGVASPMTTPIVNQGVQAGDGFKGLTFVGKMNINQPPDVSDILCLYSYHWGPTHIDIITRLSGQSLVPIKNVYGRIVPGLTRNAVSNRIPKIGAKTIALPDTHINALKKLQLPITARSHYITVEDFVRLCCYYKKTPPTNLSSFVTINANDNPAEVLKIYNSQKPLEQPSPVPLEPAPSIQLQQQAQNGQVKVEPSFEQTDFTLLSPGQINANLANSMGEVLQYATPYPLWNAQPPPVATQTPPAPSPSASTSKSSTEPTLSPTAGAEFHSLVLPDGTQIALVVQNSTPYLLNAELQHLLPQANQNVIGPLRSLLNIPLEYASRPNMNALKEVGVIGIKACRAIVYKVSDVIKMYRHWKVPVPRFLHELNNGKIPRGVVNMTPVSQSMPTNQQLPSQQIAPPISADMMSPSGVKINLGGAAPPLPKTNERRNSHSGAVSPLDDQSSYNTSFTCIACLVYP